MKITLEKQQIKNLIAQVLMGKELVEFVISKEDYENLWNMSIK